MKRLISLSLTLFLLVALAMPVFAEDSVSSSPAPDAASSIIDAAELQKMVDDFVAEYSLMSNSRSISIGFCYLKTGDTWYYNEDRWYYSASLYKVPVAMLLAEREVNGEITADTFYENQYSSGTLDTLERRSLVDSNNNTGHAMVEWMGGTYAGKCADQIIKFTDLPDSYFNKDFYDVSYYNVKFYTQVLETLYKNPDNYPRVLDYMKQAQPGAYLRTQLEGTYDIAQKYGAFEETKVVPARQNNHVGGIIYTPNPIILTIMSVNMESYNARIGELAKMFADYALTLDSRYDSYVAEQELLARQEADRLAAEEAERLAAEEQKQAAEEAAAVPAPVVSTPAPTSAVNTSSPVFATQAPVITQQSSSSGIDLGSTQKIIIVVGLAVFIVGLALLLVVLNMKRRRKFAEADDYADDYPDDDASYDDSPEDEYLEPPEVRRTTSRSASRSSRDAYPEDDYSSYDSYDDAGAEGDYSATEDNGYYDESYDDADAYDAPDAAPSASSEEAADEYLSEEDYLEDDTFLDAQDYNDFSKDYGYSSYSAYDDEDFSSDTDSASDRSSGSRYKPRH